MQHHLSHSFRVDLHVGPEQRLRIPPPTVQWSQPLWVRNRPRLGRVELGVRGHPEYIALDYSRLGIMRIVDLVAEYAGLKEKAPSDEPKAASSGQDH